MNGTITNFKSFKSKVRITGSTPNDCNTKDDQIAVQLKYLSNFWRILKIQQIIYEINLILTWSTADCFVSAANGATKFAITDTKPYVQVVTLSIDNPKLL